MSDHREEITEAAKSYTDRAREAVSEEGIENGEEIAADVEVWTSNHGSRRVEFLLAGGGPTVWVEVDQYDRATFHHSWGMDEMGQDRTTWELYGDDSEFWIAQAEEAAEIYA